MYDHQIKQSIKMNQIDIACIIDDDKLFTYLLMKQMKRINFSGSTITFHNGLDALLFLKPVLASPEALPSVILLDLNMPVLDGWQFLDAFTQLKPQKKITVYIVSSSIDQADHERARVYPSVADFYIKPVRENDLQQILSDLMVN